MPTTLKLGRHGEPDQRARGANVPEASGHTKLREA
jgi:hypothetical protein